MIPTAAVYSRNGVIRQAPRMVIALLEKLGIRGSYLHAASTGSIALCIYLWIRAKTIGEDERGNAERRALFVGLWPPMFWLLGESLERRQASKRRPRLG